MCSDLLTANPDIKGIYCMYEQAGIAAIDVVDNMGVTGKISIVSSDGSPDSTKAIREGRLAGQVVQGSSRTGLLGSGNGVQGHKRT